MSVIVLLVVVVTAAESPVFEVEDEVTKEVAREADCKVDVIGVCPVAVGIELEGFVVAAVTLLTNVGVPLLLPTVISLGVAMISLVATVISLVATVISLVATVISLVATVVPLVATVISLAAHCPAYAQYWSVAQQIDPHNVSPNPLSQINDVAHCPIYSQYCPVAQQIDPHDVSPIPLLQVNDVVAAATAVLEVCAAIELAGAEIGTDEDD